MMQLMQSQITSKIDGAGSDAEVVDIAVVPINSNSFLIMVRSACGITANVSSINLFFSLVPRLHL
jgi:hypothetical protein